MRLLLLNLLLLLWTFCFGLMPGRGEEEQAQDQEQGRKKQVALLVSLFCEEGLLRFITETGTPNSTTRITVFTFELP